MAPDGQRAFVSAEVAKALSVAIASLAPASAQALRSPHDAQGTQPAVPREPGAQGACAGGSSAATRASPGTARGRAASGASSSSASSASNSSSSASSSSESSSNTESAATQLPCPFACLGCQVTYPQKQLQRWVDHTNEHRPALSLRDGGALWTELVLQAQLAEVLWCACGLLIPNTPHGRTKHFSACEQGSAEVAADVRRVQGGNDSAFSGALAGLTTQSLDVTVQDSDVTIGSLQLTARDCGWIAGSHSNVCFYMSCADGSTTDALALKQRLAGLATALAQARLHAGSTRTASPTTAH